MTQHQATRLAFDEPGRGRVYGSILETIGDTPLVRIGKLAAEMDCKAEVLDSEPRR
jgi:cysteine synthase A